ncbi:flavin reductase family protein [Bordetella genomosp. 9]|uniref:Flavin reductase n=1 Tax=Bordetella genomosp. 9 TaxID=1416803 RepID=A0A1W6Z2V6_9BORD|nr:flavin reductase family protein [Bordetella genomosp. 9]ARP87702.1 flavin reductase [Bordetella genomosp. 9]ARP91673.1 flavin reductase [Bordetella genomosp. 9]
MSASPPDFDAAHFRTALGRFATGVTVVTASDLDGTPLGLTVSSFNSVSLSPPLVLWSLSASSGSREAFMRCERYVINVLAADQLALAERFARGSVPERYAGMRDVRAPGGTRMLDEHCAAWFECYNRSRYEEGDHIIMIGEVEHCGHSGALPLVYHAGGFDLTPAASAVERE